MTRVPQSRTSPRGLALFVLSCAAVVGIGIAVAYMVRPMVVADATGSISGACVGQLPSNFSPRIFDHCVAACIACDHGNMVTCSTSCRLKGAT
ncbi:MAG: hypothetical protein ACLP1D_26630 [Xanthobacteraceae bacterium]